MRRLQTKICGGTKRIKTFLLTLFIGIVAGTIDVLPMIRMKLDKFSIVSAFVFYLFIPFIIFNTDLFGLPWWAKGSVITLMMALPVIILVTKEGMKAAAPIALMSILLGLAIGAAGHFLLPQ